MKIKIIEFKKKPYKCRVMQDNEGNEVIVGSAELYTDLCIANGSEIGIGEWFDKDAEAVDNKIFFYTATENLELSDEEFIKEIKHNLPEFFN